MTETTDTQAREPNEPEKSIYEKLVLVIIPPIASTILSSGLPSPNEASGNPYESIDGNIDTARLPFRDALGTTVADEDVDAAVPVAELRPLNYFVNMLTSALVYAGIGGLGGLKSKLESLLGHDDYSERKVSAGIDVIETMDNLEGEHGSHDRDDDEDDGYDTDEENEEEEGSNNNNYKISNAEDLQKKEREQVELMQKRLNRAQREHDNGNEGEVAKLFESLAIEDNRNDLDQLYQAEIERDTGLIHSRRKSLSSDSDSASGVGKRRLTQFQKSILENLNPHFIKESLFLKLKEKEDVNTSTENETYVERRKREKLYLHIADKLQRVFELEDDDHFYGNYSVWLINDVLLQGHLYLTRESILFFTFLPKRTGRREDEVIQTGSLGMKTSKYGETVFTTVLTHRFWAILKPETLAIYSSTTNFYFPKLLVDLKSCIRAEIINDKGDLISSTMMATANTQKANNSSSSNLSVNSGCSVPNTIASSVSLASGRSSNDLDPESVDFLNDMDSITDEVNNIGGVWFKLVTDKKSYRFHTDNLYIARQWVNNLTKLIFQLNNTNSKDEVLFKIPIDSVIDFERNNLLNVNSGPGSGSAATPTAAATANSMGYGDSAGVDSSNSLEDEVTIDDEQPSTFSVTYTVQETEDLTEMVKKTWMRTTKKKKVEIIGPDGKLSRIEASTKYGIEEIFFLFFKDGDGFFQKFKEIMLEHGKTRKEPEISKSDRILERARKIVKMDASEKLTKRQISTLKPSDNKLVSTLKYKSRLIAEQKQQLIPQQAQYGDPSSLRASLYSQLPQINQQRSPTLPFLPHGDRAVQIGQHELFPMIDDVTLPTRSNTPLSNSHHSVESDPSSAIKRIGKTLTSPTRMFSNRKRTISNSDSIESGAPIPLERSHSEAHLNSIATAPTTHINLPRQLSLTGLKNLNMAFETSHRQMHVAESRYRDEPERVNGGDRGDFTGGYDGDNIDDDDNDDDDFDDAITMDVPKSKKTLTRERTSRSQDSELLMSTPLNIADPSEVELPNSKKTSKIRTLGKAIGNVSNLWSSNPSHFVEIAANDPYFLQDSEQREILQASYQNHFSLKTLKRLYATYLCHLRRTIPVYGKLYIGDGDVCFRSLLPGVATKMIIPMADLEHCHKERGTKLAYSGLGIQIRNFEELFIEFSSQKSRDDCEFIILDRLETINQENAKKLIGDSQSTSESVDAFGEAYYTDRKQATSRIENARIKLFEDKLTAAAGLDVPIILEDSPFFKTEIRPSSSFNFTLLTIGSRGDVQPYIALAKGLLAEGHNVTIATHKEFEEWILKHNINFKEIAGNPTELMALMVTHGSMSVAFIKEASTKFRGWIQELLATSWEACQGADILIESPSAMCGIHIAEAMGIPYFRAFTMPWTRTRAYPHAFIVPDQKKGGSYNYLTHVMFETVFWKGISSQVNRWRVEELGIPRTNLFKMQQTKVPFLYNVSPTIFPPSVDFPDWVKVTGYWFLDEGRDHDYEPSIELQEFIERARNDGKKIVYIGFGSIVVNNANTLTRAIVDAVLDSGVRCILNKGWSDRLSKRKGEDEEDDELEVELPDEIFNSGNIPHDWLFPRINAAIHHGGSGTTGASLRAGIPTVIKPFFGDQFFYASRVEEIGAGLALRKLNSKSLSKCLKIVTTDSKIIEKARNVKERIKHENGVLNAVECIYSELEYARELMVSKQQEYLRDFKSGTQTPVVYEDDENEDVDAEEEEDECDDDVVVDNEVSENDVCVDDATIMEQNGDLEEDHAV